MNPPEGEGPANAAPPDAGVNAASFSDAVDAASFSDAMQAFDLPAGARIAVAVSGGADSMALVRLLADWARPRGIDVAAVTVDHRLRAASAEEARQVGAWLAALGIAHITLPWEAGPWEAGPWEATRLVPGRSPQKAARDARYALMTAWAVSENRSHLFLAHHADDQVETFLIRLTRGSGVNGLAAMAAMRPLNGVILARPLLGFPKTALVAVCRAAGQGWIEDPSNANPAATRVRFRQAAGLLASEGFTAARLLDTVGHMQRARAALDQAVEKLLSEACVWDECAVARLETAAVLAAPEEIALRALAQVLMAASGQTYTPRFESLTTLYRRLTAGPWRDSTLHGCVIARDGNSLSIFREAAQIDHACALTPAKQVLWDGRFGLSASDGGPFKVAAVTPKEIPMLSGDAGNPDSRPGGGRGLSQIPAPVALTLPAIFDSAGLAAVPHLHFLREDLSGIAFKMTCIPALKPAKAGGFTRKTVGPVPGAEL